MHRIFTHPRAEQDLLDIWLYTFDKWGERQTDAYIDELNAILQILAEQPLMCRERTEFTPPVRIHHHAQHLVVYLALNNGINVIRVLHESMEVGEHVE